jgi:hypothetical protein
MNDEKNEKLVDATEVLSEREAFIRDLPAHLRTQIANGVIDPSNIPKEDLIRMTLRGATDGDALELAGRGIAKDPLNYMARANEGEATVHEVTVPKVPNNRRGGNDKGF